MAGIEGRIGFLELDVFGVNSAETLPSIRGGRFGIDGKMVDGDDEGGVGIDTDNFMIPEPGFRGIKDFRVDPTTPRAGNNDRRSAASRARDFKRDEALQVTEPRTADLDNLFDGVYSDKRILNIRAQGRGLISILLPNDFGDVEDIDVPGVDDEVAKILMSCLGQSLLDFKGNDWRGVVYKFSSFIKSVFEEYADVEEPLNKAKALDVLTMAREGGVYNGFPWSAYSKIIIALKE